MQSDGDIQVGAPFIEGATVTAEVIEEFKGKKLRVTTYKPKKRESRTLGHRQTYTRIKVSDILPAKAKKA